MSGRDSPQPFPCAGLAAWALIPAFFGATGCERKSTPAPPAPSSLPAPSPAGSARSAAHPTKSTDAGMVPRRGGVPGVDCGALVQRIEASPPVPGNPALDAVRHRLMAAVKAEPLWFTRPPEHEATDNVAILSYRRWLGRSAFPHSVLEQLRVQLASRPDLLRLVVLRDGYLYAEEEKLARALVQDLRLEDLFDEPEVWIQRGEHVLQAVRSGMHYVYADSPEDGERVRLVLFDRVGVGTPGPGVHLDVRSLRYRLHFQHAALRHVTATRVVADLFYGGRPVTTVLAAQGPRLKTVCELDVGAEAVQLERVRSDATRRGNAFRVVQETIGEMVDDRLPFDEPRREVGQEDGRLRPSWVWAYTNGRSRYRYHNVEYSVFDPRGRAYVPEVCVDFLLDTLERTSGTWWRPRGEPRGRTAGRLDLDPFDREQLRRVDGFVGFAQSHPEWFDVLDIPEAQRFEMRDRAFYDELLARADDFQPGDLVFITGRVPWDETRTVHHHSFFIFESDPITGMPLLLAGNPGRPRLVPWDWERMRTPKRSIATRVRPTAVLLERIVGHRADLPEMPPALSRGP